MEKIILEGITVDEFVERIKKATPKDADNWMSFSTARNHVDMKERVFYDFISKHPHLQHGKGKSARFLKSEIDEAFRNMKTSS